MFNIDIIKWMILMLMAASFRNGLNTESIPYDMQKQYIEEYVFEIIEEGGYDLNPAFVLAIIETESTYKWQARNGEHYGLMQINPKWQQERMAELGVKDVTSNPYDNLRVGIDYIYDILTDYPNPYDALNIYNSGSTDGWAHEYSIAVMDRKYRIEHELWDKYDAW